MSIVRVAAINAGQPFVVEAEDITLGAMKTLIKAEALAKKAWAGHENQDVLAVMDSMLPVMLKIAGRKDPAWMGRTVEDLEDSLTIPELKSFMEAVAAVLPMATGEAPKAPLA